MENNNGTKQKIINVTRYMINTNGINSFSMRELGKEMNLSRSAVYRYFKSKDELLVTITIENFKIVGNHILKLSNEIVDSKKLICKVLNICYDYGIKNQDYYQLMFRKQWDEEQISILHDSAFEAYMIFKNCLVKAQEQGYAQGKSPKQLMAMISAFIIGLIDLNCAGHLETEKGLDSPDSLISCFIDTVLV